MQESQRWQRKKAITWIGARTGQCWQTKSWASWYCVVNIHYVIWFYVISTCKIPKSSQRWYTAGCLPDQLVCPGCLAQQVLLLDAPPCLVIASCLDLPQIWCLRGLQREMHCLLNLKLTVSASVKVGYPRISDRECPDQKAEVGDWLTGFWCLELQKRNR